MFGAACFSPCKLRVLFSLMARHPTFLSTWLAVSFQFPSMCEKYYKLIFFLAEVTASMLSKLSASLWQSIAGSLEHGLQAYPLACLRHTGCPRFHVRLMMSGTSLVLSAWFL